mmetsp:Transcript_11378/g.33774  ORF Transcript_11378/g.33774 Transcript_11378/m.33774 type:complete len:94 (-) Transcript_11378:81-362(-)
MAEGEAGGGADEEEKPARNCDALLDFGACLFRGGAQTGSAIMWGTRYACYPVKETVVKCCDRTKEYTRPYVKKEVGAEYVPTFTTGSYDNDPH